MVRNRFPPNELFGFFPRPSFMGGEPAGREEVSDECDHTCFGLESLIQPLIEYDV